MSSKSKIAIAKKVRITREYLTGNISREEAARRAEVAPDVITGWARIYRQEGVLGLTPQKKNRVYSQELKKQAVLEYLSGGCSQHAICEKYKIRSRKQLRCWIKKYNNHGELDSVKHSGGGSYMRKARSTTPDERIRIVKDCIASGKNYGEMALKYNVSYQQARTWTLNFEKMGEAGLQDRRGQRKKDQTPRTELEQAQIEIEQLKHKLYLAEMENALLKKLDEVERRDASRK
ncbi:MAG: transposase [Acholeplasmataceae bacterium]|nr:transposase [Acholeplasmataceae bacterium]